MNQAFTGGVTSWVRHDRAGTRPVPAPRTPRARPSWRVLAATRLGHLAETLSRSSGLGAGGVIGGRVLLALAPTAVLSLIHI